MNMDWEMKQPPHQGSVTLLDLLNTSLVLRQIAPYIPLRSSHALALAARAYHDVLRNPPETYRYLDMSKLKLGSHVVAPIDIGGINWRSERMDEALTEDDFYCGPIRGLFSALARQHILSHVQIMVLDGLTVPADLIYEVITEDRFNVRVLSIRDVRHLNLSKLRQALKFIVRPSRPKGTPKLRALYVFSAREQESLRLQQQNILDAMSLEDGYGVTASEGAQIGSTWNERSHGEVCQLAAQCNDDWYQKTGRNISLKDAEDWAPVLQACEGIIAFDAVLCRGPRHNVLTVSEAGLSGEDPRESWLPAAVASVALGPSGCVKCGSCPEKPAYWGASPAPHLPLLSPMSRHSTVASSSQRPSSTLNPSNIPFIARCEGCLRGRWCERCLKWWCESCYNEAWAEKRSSKVRRGSLEAGVLPNSGDDCIKIHMGLCTEICLISEMMSGAGSFGMWG